MSNSWGAKVLQRFDGAATQYNQAARLQTAMAWRLAGCCKRLPIPSGRWLDLGSGTGLLADAIEQRNPGRVVERIDGSPSMLARNSRPDHTQLWDLNQPLEGRDDPPTLIASSFCLHWLSDPGTRLQNWFECLAPGGWLIVALPVKGCFPQWHAAAHQAAVPCSALSFPTTQALLASIPKQQVRQQQQLCFSEQASYITALLRPMQTIGAGTSTHSALSVKQWRQLSAHWPERSAEGQVRLTWLIQILVIER
ncbi:MAG: methyltransferase domain-containing protein [Synechococcus sp. cluster3_bin.96]|nr:methyltransferase domain-containing protein [Synechococcus sp. cluster3_bin.96]